MLTFYIELHDGHFLGQWVEDATAKANFNVLGLIQKETSFNLVFSSNVRCQIQIYERISSWQLMRLGTVVFLFLFNV